MRDGRASPSSGRRGPYHLCGTVRPAYHTRNYTPGDHRSASDFLFELSYLLSHRGCQALQDILRCPDCKLSQTSTHMSYQY